MHISTVYCPSSSGHGGWFYIPWYISQNTGRIQGGLSSKCDQSALEGFTHPLLKYESTFRVCRGLGLLHSRSAASRFASVFDAQAQMRQLSATEQDRAVVADYLVQFDQPVSQCLISPPVCCMKSRTPRKGQKRSEAIWIFDEKSGCADSLSTTSSASSGFACVI